MAKEDKLAKVLEELVKEVRLLREVIEQVLEKTQPSGTPPPSYLEESQQWNCPPPNYVGDWVYTPRSTAETVNKLSNSSRTIVE